MTVKHIKTEYSAPEDNAVQHTFLVDGEVQVLGGCAAWTAEQAEKGIYSDERLRKSMAAYFATLTPPTPVKAR